MEHFTKLREIASSQIPLFVLDWENMRRKAHSHFNFHPNQLEEIDSGREFEIFLLGMTFGYLISLDFEKLPRDKESVDKLIATCLLQNDETTCLEWESAIPLVQNRIVAFRKDLVGVLTSDYPRTKQYLPYLTFNIINYAPLQVDQDISWANLDDEGWRPDKAEMVSGFLGVMTNHFNRILSKLK